MTKPAALIISCVIYPLLTVNSLQLSLSPIMMMGERKKCSEIVEKNATHSDVRVFNNYEIKHFLKIKFHHGCLT